MRRGIGVIVAALIALAALAMPAYADSCVSSGGGPAGGGVVLGPATKCVRDGTATLPGANAGAANNGGTVKTASSTPANGPAAVVWFAAIPAALVLVFGVRGLVRRRRVRLTRPQPKAA